jgi:hypothetical protein
MLNKRPTVLMFAVCLVFISDLAQSQRQSQQQETGPAQQQPGANKQGAEESPIIVTIPTPPQAQTETKPAQNERHNEWLYGWSLSDRIAAIANLVGFLQFLALIATVWVMIKNGRRQLRAYVLTEGNSARLIEVTDDESKKVQLYIIESLVKLQNFGQTPANNYRSWVRIEVLPTGSDPFDETHEGFGRGIIAPSSGMDIVIRRISSEDEITAIRNGEKRIFVCGEVLYTDVFDVARYFRFYCWNANEIPGKGWRWPTLIAPMKQIKTSCTPGASLVSARPPRRGSFSKGTREPQDRRVRSVRRSDDDRRGGRRRPARRTWVARGRRARYGAGCAR